MNLKKFNPVGAITGSFFGGQSPSPSPTKKAEPLEASKLVLPSDSPKPSTLSDHKMKIDEKPNGNADKNSSGDRKPPKSRTDPGPTVQHSDSRQVQRELSSSSAKLQKPSQSQSHSRTMSTSSASKTATPIHDLHRTRSAGYGTVRPRSNSDASQNPAKRMRVPGHPYSNHPNSSDSCIGNPGENVSTFDPKKLLHKQGSKDSKDGETRRRKWIFFYEKDRPYYGFTNFSDHPVKYQGKVYPTSEHLFQSFKFQQHRPLLAEHIRTYSPKPALALSEARRFQHEARTDWLNENIRMMDTALIHKFTQHRELYEELLGTGDAELVEDSDKDAFWGVGKDRKGRNELGKALMRLRDLLRATPGMAPPPRPLPKDESDSKRGSKADSNRPKSKSWFFWKSR